MAPKVPRERVPWFVQFTTGGRPSTRKRMLFSLAIILVLVVVAWAVWLSDPTRAFYLLVGVVGLGITLAQVLAVRWIDRNGTWASNK